MVDWTWSLVQAFLAPPCILNTRKTGRVDVTTALFLNYFEGVPRRPGEIQDKGKETRRGPEHSLTLQVDCFEDSYHVKGGNPPRSLEVLLGLFSLFLVFPWPPWNSMLQKNPALQGMKKRKNKKKLPAYNRHPNVLYNDCLVMHIAVVHDSAA